MDTLDHLSDISSRIDHLEMCAEWISRETATSDTGLCQTATLITALADEIREKICKLIKDVERGVEIEKLN